jgi:hypothetical protein
MKKKSLELEKKEREEFKRQKDISLKLRREDCKKKLALEKEFFEKKLKLDQDIFEKGKMNNFNEYNLRVKN